MRTYYYLLILFLLPFGLFSQNLDWANITYGTGADILLDMSIDKEGNIYSVGFFSNDTYFNEDSEKLTATGHENSFIQKIDSKGKLIWKQQISSKSTAIGVKVAVDSKGNCYILGYFNQNLTIQETTLLSNGLDDIFVAKFSKDGTLINIKQIGSKGVEFPSDIEIDTQDNIYITGTFANTLDFGIEKPNKLTSKHEYGNQFIAKYSKDNTLVWVEQFGDDETFLFLDLEIKNKQVVLSGLFDGQSVDFDPSEEKYILNSENRNDGFILKLDTDGKFKNVFQIEATWNLFIMSMVIDEDQNTYAIGYFNESIKMKDTPNVEHTAQKFIDIIVFKLDASNKLAWTRQFKSESDAFGLDLTLDNKNNLIVTGAFLQDLKLTHDDDDHEIILKKDFSNRAESFFATISNQGEIINAYQYGGVYLINTQCVLTDNEDNLILAGSFQDNIDLDPSKDSNKSFTSKDDGHDSYIIKLKKKILGTDFPQEKYSYYPNPVVDVIQLNLSTERVKYEIINTIGMIIQKGETQGTIDLKSLQTGMYFLKIKGYQTIKVLKK